MKTTFRTMLSITAIISLMMCGTALTTFASEDMIKEKLYEIYITEEELKIYKDKLAIDLLSSTKKELRPDSKILGKNVQNCLRISKNYNFSPKLRLEAANILYKASSSVPDDFISQVYYGFKQAFKMLNSELQTLGIGAYLYIAQDSMVDIKSRIEAAQYLFMSYNEETYKAGIQALSFIAQDSKVDSSDRLYSAAEKLFESKNKEAHTAGIQAYLSIAMDLSVDRSVHYLSAAKTLFESTDDHAHKAGIQALSFIAQDSIKDHYGFYKTEAALLLFRSDDEEAQKAGIQALSFLARLDDPHLGYVNPLKTLLDSQNTESQKEGVKICLSVIKDTKTDFNKILNYLKALLDSVNSDVRKEGLKLSLDLIQDSRFNDYLGHHEMGWLLRDLKNKESQKEVLESYLSVAKNSTTDIKYRLKAAQSILNSSKSLEQDSFIWKVIKELIFGDLGKSYSLENKIYIIDGGDFKVPEYQQIDLPDSGGKYDDFLTKETVQIIPSQLDEKKVKSIEKIFLDTQLSRNKDYLHIRDIREKTIKNLISENELAPLLKIPGIKISQEFSLAYKVWIKDVIADEVKAVQKSLGLKEFPKFSVLSIGSLARGEALLFSDLEIIFLVETNDENTRYILECLNQRIANRIYLLGEDTSSDFQGNLSSSNLEIKKIPTRHFIGIHVDSEENAPPYDRFMSRNHASPQYFKDLLEDSRKINMEQLNKISTNTMNGEDDFKRLYFAMKRLSSLGKKADDYKKVIEFSKKGSLISIVTPKDLAHYSLLNSSIPNNLEDKVNFEEETKIRPFLDKNKIKNSTTLLRNIDIIYGDKLLFKEYTNKRDMILNQKIPSTKNTIRQELFLTESDDWQSTFKKNLLNSEKLIEKLIPDDCQYDISDKEKNLKRQNITGKGSALDHYKRYFYRPLEQFVTNLAFLYNTQAKDTLGILKELESNKLISTELSEMINHYMNVAFTLRLRQQAADMNNKHTRLLMTKEELQMVQKEFVDEFLLKTIPDFVSDLQKKIKENPENYLPLEAKVNKTNVLEISLLSVRPEHNHDMLKSKDKNDWNEKNHIEETLLDIRALLGKNLVSNVYIKNHPKFSGDYSNLSEEDYQKICNGIQDQMGTTDLKLWQRLLSREVSYGEKGYHVLYQGNGFGLMLYYETIKLLRELNLEKPLGLRAYSHAKIQNVDKFWGHYFDPLSKELVNDGHKGGLQTLLASVSYDLLYNRMEESCIYFYKDNKNASKIEFVTKDIETDIFEHLIEDTKLIKEIKKLIADFISDNQSKTKSGGIIQTFIKKEKINDLAYLSKAWGYVDKNHLSGNNIKNDLNSFLTQYKNGEQTAIEGYDQARLLARSPLLENPETVSFFYDYDAPELILIEAFKEKLRETFLNKI